VDFRNVAGHWGLSVFAEIKKARPVGHAFCLAIFRIANWKG
jgi:hypothetical protein